ncbi:hypothetical protein [Actinophytocola gossypii]|uniref:Uncharacterized protein n=1 Tax=Actinophytocola gossypii TaxID=2812003 RepID=A0ABT2JBK4_9PSEU|nr:hypothetical protein [Actinophytocola gossypii]MCT2584944.1 hypothetical protein [Actinophytocola gossypii]
MERTISTTVRASATLVTGAHCLLVCAQPVLAGMSLEGVPNAIEWHGGNGSIILTVAMVQVLTGALWWKPGGGSPWVPLAALALFFAESVQHGWGHAFRLTLHIPLGIAIVVLSVVLFVVLVRAPRSRPS